MIPCTRGALRQRPPLLEEACPRRESLSSATPNICNGPRTGVGFKQLQNKLLTAASRIANKQAIGEVLEWASSGVLKYGDTGRTLEADTPELRAATDLMTSALDSTTH